MVSPPAVCCVVAADFVEDRYYQHYSDTAHLTTTEEYWEGLHNFLQEQGITRIRIAGWSLGCFLAHGFLRRFGDHYDIVSVPTYLPRPHKRCWAPGLPSRKAQWFAELTGSARLGMRNVGSSSVHGALGVTGFLLSCVLLCL